MDTFSLYPTFEDMEYLRQEVAGLVIKGHNLPSTQQFELIDRISGVKTSINELSDICQLNGRHFDLVLLNGVQAVEETE